MVSPFYKIAKSASPSKISDPLDIAACYFVYKLCEATGGRPIERQLLRSMGETLEIVLCSVERESAASRAMRSPSPKVPRS